MDTSQPSPSHPPHPPTSAPPPSSSAVDAHHASAPDTQPSDPAPQPHQTSSEPIKTEGDAAATPPPKPAPPAAVPRFSASTQEILKRVSAGSNISTGTKEWEAAREQVLQTMSQGNHVAAPVSTPTPTRGGGTDVAEAASVPSQGAGLPVTGTGEAAAETTPVRGRGRGGRPRGKSRGHARGRGRGPKRKRNSDGLSDDDDASNASDSYTPQPTVTKSGRNVTKPSQYKPITEQSPTSEPKKKRPYRKGPEYTTLCEKCQRGHSPLSNAIVFCDGCNAAYHQFCHDPHIPREVIEIPEKEWFCGRCLHVKEAETLRLQDRVSGEDLTREEKSAYLHTLSSATLVSLLLHATAIYPNLPIFAPNTRSLLHPRPVPPSSSMIPPTPPTSQPPQQPAHSMPPPNQPSRPIPAPSVPTNANTNASYPSSHHADNTTDARTANNQAEEDPYPDYPPTYPRPGHGPMKIQPTNDMEGAQWLSEEDHYGVFSHMYNDGSGNLVPVHQHPQHQQQQQQRWQQEYAGYHHMQPAPNGQHMLSQQQQQQPHSPHGHYVPHFVPQPQHYAQAMNGGGGAAGPMSPQQHAHAHQVMQQQQQQQQHHGGGMHQQRTWQ